MAKLAPRIGQLLRTARSERLTKPLLLTTAVLALCEALLAVYWTVPVGFERNFAFFLTF